MNSSFKQSPLRVAILLALAAFSAYSSAADIELKAPPGGRVVVKDATGATVQLMVDAAGVVTVPALVGSGTTSLNVVCFDAAGALAKCVGLVGAGAGELIAEAVVAIEMGATVEDLALCVHPHPTVSETIMEAAEVFFGTSTHTYTRKKAE